MRLALLFFAAISLIFTVAFASSAGVVNNLRDGANVGVGSGKPNCNQCKGYYDQCVEKWCAPDNRSCKAGCACSISLIDVCSVRCGARCDPPYSARAVQQDDAESVAAEPVVTDTSAICLDCMSYYAACTWKSCAGLSKQKCQSRCKCEAVNKNINCRFQCGMNCAMTLPKREDIKISAAQPEIAASEAGCTVCDFWYGDCMKKNCQGPSSLLPDCKNSCRCETVRRDGVCGKKCGIKCGKPIKFGERRQAHCP